MKNQKGFIHMPLLIAIITGILVLGGGGYLGVKQYQNYQAEEIEKEKQQQALLQAQVEIEKLKTQNIETKKKQGDLEKRLKTNSNPQSQNLSISTSEIDTYIGGVTQVSCTNSEGSGFLMNLDMGYVTVTNDHVIAGNSWCNVLPENSSGETLGHFQLNLTSPYEWNPYTDIVILKMSISPAAQSWSKPTASLNYNLTNLKSCPSKIAVGSPLVVIGYPAFGKQQIQVEGYNSKISARQVTEGIISGYDTSVEKPIGNLPYPNYYVSAKIDSGNSGGVALSKDSNGLCLLGVATWLSLGNFETQGVVQNIHNVMYVR